MSTGDGFCTRERPTSRYVLDFLVLTVQAYQRLRQSDHSRIRGSSVAVRLLLKPPALPVPRMSTTLCPGMAFNIFLPYARPYHVFLFFCFLFSVFLFCFSVCLSFYTSTPSISQASTRSPADVGLSAMYVLSFIVFALVPRANSAHTVRVGGCLISSLALPPALLLYLCLVHRHLCLTPSKTPHRRI